VLDDYICLSHSLQLQSVVTRYIIIFHPTYPNILKTNLDSILNQCIYHKLKSIKLNNAMLHQKTYYLATKTTSVYGQLVV